jgi:hypothetical protein
VATTLLDVRDTLRAIRREPVYAGAVIATLALTQRRIHPSAKDGSRRRSTPLASIAAIVPLADRSSALLYVLRLAVVDLL